MPRLPVTSPYALAAALFLASSSAAAQTTPGPLRLAAVNAESAEQIEALVELSPGTTAGGAEDFAFLEDGRATSRASAITPFRTAGWTLAAVLAIDTSGSVARILPAITEATTPFVAALPEQDAVALITFDDHVHLQAPFGTPREEVIASVEAMQPHGRRTLLYQALTQGLELLQQNAPVRATRRIIVVSDGADESVAEASATDDIITLATDAQVALDTIWVGGPVASRRNTLVRLAERTGGIHTDAIDPAALVAAIAAGLSAVSARVDAGVVLTFPRTVDPSLATSTVGVTITGQTMAPAVIAMQIPGSAPDAAAMAWWLLLLLALGAAYLLYAISYALVLWLAPGRLALFPFRPWPAFGSHEVIEEAPPEPERRRRGPTVVRRDAAVPTGRHTGSVLVLEAIDGPLTGQRITVAHNQFQIGAGTDNDLRIASDAHLSSTHALFETANDHWSVRDQDSSNGTFIDGRRLAAERSHELQAGQILRVGASEFRVFFGETARAAAPISEPEPLR